MPAYPAASAAAQRHSPHFESGVMGKDDKAVKDQAFVRVSAAGEAVSQAHEEAEELATC